MFSLNSCCGSNATFDGHTSCPEALKLSAKLDHVIQLLTGNKSVADSQLAELSPSGNNGQSKDIKAVKPRMTNIREEDSEEKSS